MGLLGSARVPPSQLTGLSSALFLRHPSTNHSQTPQAACRQKVKGCYEALGLGHCPQSAREAETWLVSILQYLAWSSSCPSQPQPT